jgi:hypothetical protein
MIEAERTVEIPSYRTARHRLWRARLYRSTHPSGVDFYKEFLQRIAREELTGPEIAHEWITANCAASPNKLPSLTADREFDQVARVIIPDSQVVNDAIAHRNIGINEESTSSSSTTHA